MRAGKLNERVTVQAWTEGARGSMGSSTGSWGTHATVWAEVIQIRGQEAQRLATQNATATYRVRIRRLTTVTNAMRVLWGSKILKIEAPPEHQRTEGMTVLLCTERATP